MLAKLTIKNYVLINELELQPDKHFSIITGETGAGKSILLGALGLLIGDRADSKSLADENTKCVIEAEILLNKQPSLINFLQQEELYEDNTCIIRREISPAGKSRAFVNDTPVTIDLLKQLSSYLIDIHSQHETLLLQKENFQLDLVDFYSDNQSLLEQYKQAFTEYQKSSKALQTLIDNAEALRKEADFNQFLFDELHNASLIDPEEDKRLEEELKRDENIELIKEQLTAVKNTLDESEINVNTQLHFAIQSLKQIDKFDVKYSSWLQRIESCMLELQDVATEAEKENEYITFDPQAIATKRERSSLLFNLFKKHHVDNVQSLIDIKNDLEEKLSKVANLDADITRLTTETEEKHKIAQLFANKISEKRKSASLPLAKEITDNLAQLGMPEAVLEIKVSEIEILNSNGKDKVTFYFSANKGRKPELLKQAASGGEFSRLMFTLKYIMAEKTQLPTVIFDEIDTGISGEIAVKMAKMMKKMSKNHQIIAITHLPQIASTGDTHFYVYKDHTGSQTNSSVRKLNSNERVNEIAKMIGGETITQSMLENARELLQASV